VKEKRTGYKSKIVFLMWTIFIAVSPSLALDPQRAITQYKQETWQEAHGLSQKAIVEIRQSSDGYLWLGTMRGLARFDGIRFKTFDRESYKHFQRNRIMALLADRKGNLWIGTSRGGLVCYKNGDFKTYPVATYPFLKGIHVIFEDSQGSLWVGTRSNGLARLKDEEFITFTSKDGVASDKIRDFYQDEKGRLWIATSAGITIRDSSGSFTPFTWRNTRFDKYTTSMLKRKNGELWLGTMVGLYCLKNDRLKHLGEQEGLTNPTITSLYEDRAQNLWAGTDGGGLVRIKNNRIESFPTGHEMASLAIYAIYEDREKNLWLGSTKNGLHRLRNTPFTPYTKYEGLTGDRVRCVHEDRQGRLWFGTDKGMNRMKIGNSPLDRSIEEVFGGYHVTAVMEDRRGTLWFGTDSGLYRYKNGKIESFNNHHSILKQEIIQIEEDKNGAVWILTDKNIGRFANGKYTELINIKGEKNNYFRAFYIDREGTIWIASYGSGVYKYKAGKFIYYTTKSDLVHNEVESFYEDKKGTLYIGTREGLSILKEGTFFNCTTQNGLIDSFIYYILEDEQGYLWLSGTSGLSRVNKAELDDYCAEKIKTVNPVLYTEQDGLKSSISHHSIKARDDTLWFATDKGAMNIDPAQIKKHAPNVPVLLEELVVDGEAFNIRSFREDGSKGAVMDIQPGKNRFEFFYTGLSFVKPRDIAFKLKLEGYDRDWVERGNIRDISYTGLSPGLYTFKVKAGTSTGEWNEEAASFSFYLKPYFYQTPWFYVSVVFLVLSMAFSIYRLRVRQLKTRQRELAALVDLRTHEVKEKNKQLEEQSEKLKELDKVKSRFFANISHEFRTPLTLLMGPLEQMVDAPCDNVEDRKKQLTLMLRNAQRLLRLINQLLELSRLDTGQMKLQAVKADIVPFVKGIAASFQLLTQQKEVDLVFHADTENEDVSLYIDPRKMEDILSNLLINAVKFTPPGGKVTLAVRTNPAPEEDFPAGYVEIAVSDTGPGIPVDQLVRIFDRFFQADSTYEYHQKGSGIGLALSKELVELHHGTITANSREGEGSQFIIHLPMGDQHLSEDEIASAPPSQDRTVQNNNTSAKIQTLDMEMDEEEDENETETGFDLDAEAGAIEKNIILVVEDNKDMREYIRSALEPDYIVTGAGDGKEGIEKAMEIIPDLVVSDIMMPEVDGYELCRTLKTDVQTSHIPIILLTAVASEENILQGFETGADDYITKPFSTKILSARIKNLIEIRTQLQQNFKRELNLQPVRTSVSTIDRGFLKDLQAVVKENISDPEFNVEEMCKKLYMPNTTLYRKIQALCGLNPTEFIRSYRLKRAAQLLKNGFGSVTEVAFEVGFSSRAYFTKCFKEKFHSLPSKFIEE
jgi:signal transduction histidine kinase/ligand-binding sensor domain-containing protein/DNA-binding NarL/FixJ family response regulator